MRARPVLRRLLAGVTTVVTLAVSGVVVGIASAGSASAACSDIDVVFARGTGESPGLGSVGGPFVSSLTSDLSGRTVSSYAVNYAANVAQTSAGPGATDMSNHISSVAASCPGTRFVIGGYSQGASVTDIAVGIQTGTSSGTAIPANLAGRVAAVVVFGNPLGISGRTIATASSTYGARSRDYCNTGDPVCGAGSNFAAHLQYVSNGSTTSGAQFAAGLVGTSTSPSPTPTPTPTPTPPAATCVRASTTAHVAAGRAVSVFGRSYARGTGTYLGATSSSNIVSLQASGTNSWRLVPSC